MHQQQCRQTTFLYGTSATMPEIHPTPSIPSPPLLDQTSPKPDTFPKADLYLKVFDLCL